MKRGIFTLAFVSQASVMCMSATASEMTASELKETFAGKTIYLSAPFGALPISYSHGGSMVAQSKAMALFSGISRDEGNWRISGNQFCQRWKTWLGGKEQCFTVRREGNTMRWTSNDGMSGTARAGK